MKRAILWLVLMVLAVTSVAISFATPARNLTDIGDASGAPILQWFRLRHDEFAVSSADKEFYDNVHSGTITPTEPWGGWASWGAIGGVVINIEMDPSDAITGFTVRAWITNDLYNFGSTLTGTEGQNSHRQFAPAIEKQKVDSMVDVRMTASFADDGIPGNLPDVSPFGAEANIYGVDYESLGWFSFYEGELPPLPSKTGGYWVPAWNFTGPNMGCTGGTPEIILPGETHYRDMEFACYRPIRVGDPDYDTIMDSWINGTELFLNRTNSLKVSNYPDTLSVDPCVPYPEYSPGLDSDVSVFYNVGVAPVKWDQPPVPAHPENIYYGWNEPSCHPGEWIVADDWVCHNDDPVTAIHWWGSFAGWKEATPPTELMPAYFHITIWTDVSQGPNNPFSHPGEVIWAYDTTDFTVEFAGWDYDPRTKDHEACFRFNTYLPESNWFFQKPDPSGTAVYWISIVAGYGFVESQFPSRLPWGWKTRPRDVDSPAPDAAVRIFGPTYRRIGDLYEEGEPICWPTSEDPCDMAFELTARTTLEDIKWDQPPIPGGDPSTFIGWDEESVYGGVQIVGDDWVCLDSRPVSDIHWWGSYAGWTGTRPPEDPPVVGFHIGIWTDVPASAINPFSHPGQMIWEWWAYRDSVKETFVGYDVYPGRGPESCFSYSLKLPQEAWFWQTQTPGMNVFWLTISADYTWGGEFPHPWGWKTRVRNPLSPAPDSAVDVLSPTRPVLESLYKIGRPVLDQNGTPMDMAFRLTSPFYGEAYLKWSQPPAVHHGPYFLGWNELSVYGRQQIAADDWVCTSNQPITDIRWWGSLLGWTGEDPPRMPDGFHITVWDDVPAGGNGGYSHPCKVIHVAYCNNFKWEFVGWDIDPRGETPPEACFQFDAKLDPEQWFQQTAGDNIYWLSIAAVYLEETPEQNLWGWKTRPRDTESPAPDAAVRIFDPTNPWLGNVFVSGEPIYWPEPRASWDMTFVLSSHTAGNLAFDYNSIIPNHFWWHTAAQDPYNEMISLRVSADPTEDVIWKTLTLQAFGSGNDAADISSVDVWLDNDNDVQVNPAVDTWIGLGTFQFDDGKVTITLGTLPPPVAPVVIPAGSTVNVLISYTMVSPTVGSTFSLQVVGAAGTGQISGTSVPVYGLPLSSAWKIVSSAPISIGEAKQQPVGSLVTLVGKVVTADLSFPVGMLYAEEENRSAGIGLVMLWDSIAGGSEWPTVGDRISVMGRTVLLYGQTSAEGTELAIIPEYTTLTPGEPINSLGMTNQSSGGAKFGFQPGVYDNAGSAALPKLANGLNTIGSLVTTWGRVTCPAGEIETPWGTAPVFWIDDGSSLVDGFVCLTNRPSVGIAVLAPGPEVVPYSYCIVTGIMKAIPNPAGLPVRLLVPRSYEDIMFYPLD